MANIASRVHEGPDRMNDAWVTDEVRGMPGAARRPRDMFALARSGLRQSRRSRQWMAGGDRCLRRAKRPLDSRAGTDAVSLGKVRDGRASQSLQRRLADSTLGPAVLQDPVSRETWNWRQALMSSQSSSTEAWCRTVAGACANTDVISVGSETSLGFTGVVTSKGASSPHIGGVRGRARRCPTPASAARAAARLR